MKTWIRWAGIGLALVAGCDRPPPREPVDVTARLAGAEVVQGVLHPAHDLAWVGEGWHQPEGDRRWTASPAATLRVRLREARPGRIRIEARAPGPARRTLSIMINGVVLPAASLGPGVKLADVAIPAGVLRPGINDITLGSEPVERVGGRDLGVFVGEVRLEPGAAPGDEPAAALPPPPDGRLRLDARRWIEDRTGLVGTAPIEVSWQAVGAAVDDTLELLAVGPDGALESVDSAPVQGAAGTVRLESSRPGAAGHVLWTRSGSAVEVRVTRFGRPRPDVVLIVVDTWRADHVGVLRPDLVSTPRIDELAAESWLYRNAFSHIPITGPSHASLFTGRLPSEAGVVNNHVHRLDPDLPTLVTRLHAYGYRTRGTVSLDPIHLRFGFGHGFDSYRSDLGPGGILRASEVLDQVRGSLADAPGDTVPRFDFVHFCDPHEPYDAHGLVDHRATVRLGGEPLLEVSTSDYSPRALDLDLGAGDHELLIESDWPWRIRRLRLEAAPRTGAAVVEPVRDDHYEGQARFTLRVERAGPVRLLLCLDDRDGDVEEIRARYAREVEAVDAAVGEVLDLVKARGRWDDTLVILTSDHGEALGWHGDVGHVQYLYDPYVHVPLIIKPPAAWGWKTGTIHADLVALSDLPVAVLSALDVPVPDTMTGRDVFDDPRGAADAILLETHAPQAKFTRYALRNAFAKAIWTPAEDRWEFYDLRMDPEEQDEIHAPQKGRVGELRDALDERVKELLDESSGRASAVLDDESAEILRSLGYVN